MRIINIHFGHYVGKCGTGTEFSHIFCAGIGPLQLGVVLVLIILYENRARPKSFRVYSVYLET